MLSIYILKPANYPGTAFHDEIVLNLASQGNQVTSREIGSIPELSKSMLNEILDYDVIILLISDVIGENYLNNADQIIKAVLETDDKLFISVQREGNSVGFNRETVRKARMMRYKDESSSAIDRILIQINGSINSLLSDRIGKKEQAKVVRENIENSKTKFIENTTKGLENRERKFKSNATLWYMARFASIAFGIGVATLLTYLGVNNLTTKNDWSLVTFYTIKSLLIIILLISLSKYAFSLARSNMSESLRIADRLHAISFGEFFLNVFNEQINPAELKDIFRDWNINNQSNSFSTQSTSDYDPKIIEKWIEIVDKIKGNPKE